MGDAISEIYIKDDEYLLNREQYAAYAEKIQQQWEKFVAAAQKLKADNIVTGERINLYDDFIGLAQASMSDQMMQIIQLTARDMKLYIENIDEADDIVY